LIILRYALFSSILLFIFCYEYCFQFKFKCIEKFKPQVLFCCRFNRRCKEKDSLVQIWLYWCFPCTGQIYMWGSDLYVHFWFTCESLIYMYMSGLQVHKWITCTGLIYMYKLDLQKYLQKKKKPFFFFKNSCILKRHWGFVINEFYNHLY